MVVEAGTAPVEGGERHDHPSGNKATLTYPAVSCTTTPRETVNGRHQWSTSRLDVADPLAAPRGIEGKALRLAPKDEGDEVRAVEWMPLGRRERLLDLEER